MCRITWIYNHSKHSNCCNEHKYDIQKITQQQKTIIRLFIPICLISSKHIFDIMNKLTGTNRREILLIKRWQVALSFIANL